MKLFRELHERGTTIIMITHSDEIAGYADRMVKIIDGELVDAFGNKINDDKPEQENEEAYTPDVEELSGQEVEQ